MATAPPTTVDGSGFTLPNPDNGTTGGTYPLAYPAPNSTIDRRQLAQLAATVGTQLAQNVNDAQAAFAGAASQTYVNAQISGAVAPLASQTYVANAVTNGAQPLPGVALRYMGGRLAQIVETRADGSTNVWTMSYSGDVLTGATTSNPAKTWTFTGPSATPTGWTVA